MNDEDKTMIEEAERLASELSAAHNNASSAPPKEGKSLDWNFGYSMAVGQLEDAGPASALLPRLAARLRAVLEELNDAKNERDAIVETNAANVHTSEAAQEPTLRSKTSSTSFGRSR